MTTGILHAIFIIYRLYYLRGSLTKYLLLSAPSVLTEYYLDKLGRPRYSANGELSHPGEDMAAKGVTEYLWDIVHATWVCLGLVGVLGEWAWWVGLLVPAYAVYLAWGLYKGFAGGAVPGMPQMGGGREQEPAGASKRQAKMEARGGQKVRYR